MALQSQLIFPVKKFNGDLLKFDCSKKVNAKRNLFEKLSPSACKKGRYDENATSFTKSKKKTQSTSSLVTAKQVFHTGQPSRIIGRSKEISEIETFLKNHINKRQAASLYICGAPGTGKTSCLMTVIESWEKKISYAFINCMSVNNPNDIYTSIAKEFKLRSTAKNVKSLEKYITTSASMNILILDEIDHLDSKGQEVLYSLFEWPQMPNSSLILIGIANALDLTDRLLPRLHVFKYEPKIMHFQPYTKEQIVKILEDRLSSLQNNLQIIKPVALQLCARKIAACTGDIRKALDVCRRAIEVVQNKRKVELVLQSTSDDRCNPGSPMKGSASGLCVDVTDISAVLQEIYGSRLQSTESSKLVTMPLQQMLLLCSIILMKKHSKRQDMTLGKLYDVYKQVCNKREITAVTEWEFSGLCKLLESRGFVALKLSKAFRMAKVILKIDEAEAEYLLQDKAMLHSILSDKSLCC